MKKCAPVLILVLLLVFLVMSSVVACGGEEAGDADTGTTEAAPAQTTEAAPPESTEATAPEASEGAPADGDIDLSGRTILRLASPHPLGDPVVDVHEYFIDAFNAAQDKYAIELHPSGALMAMGDEFQALQSGAVELAEWPVAAFGSIVPEFNLAELPFAVNSIEGDAAYTAEMHKIYAEVLPEKYNMRPVFCFTCQGLDIISKKPVKTLEDWNGLLCQTISPVTANVVKLLGGAGVAQDWSEGYQSLQKGVIDATLQSGSMVVMFKLYEVAKYVTRAYLTPAEIALFINLDTYDSMPDDIRALFDECAADAEANANAEMIKVYYKSLEDMKANGMTTYNLPADERARWAEKVKPYAEELLSKVDPAVATQVRELTAKIDQEYPYKAE